MELKGSLQKVGHVAHRAWNWTERRLLVPENAGLASAGLPTYMPRRLHAEPQSREQEAPSPDKYAQYWDPNSRVGGMAVKQTSELSLPEQDCITDKN